MVALLMLALLGLGWYLADLGYYDRWYNTSLAWHKALGMLALAAGIVMNFWAAVSRAPAPPASMSASQRLSARCVHLALFVMMIAIPASGYLVSTSAGDGISMFGLFEVPALSPVNGKLRDAAVDLHYYFAYTTLVLVLLHAMAAFKHQLVDRDGTLRRML
jgi:cytochrome b561